MDGLQSQPLHDSTKFSDREFAFPSREPFVDRDQNVLDDCVDMVALWHIDEEESPFLQYTDILAQQGLSLLGPEVLQESLVKNDIKRLIAKREAECVSSNDKDGDLLFLGEPLHDLERIGGIVELINNCPELDERKTVPARAGTDFENLFPSNVRYLRKVAHDTVGIGIHLPYFLFFLPKLVPIRKTRFFHDSSCPEKRQGHGLCPYALWYRVADVRKLLLPLRLNCYRVFCDRILRCYLGPKLRDPFIHLLCHSGIGSPIHFVDCV